MPALHTGPVAIYARCASSLQGEASLAEQVHRCRQQIQRHGGNARDAPVFSDCGSFGNDIVRPGLQALIEDVRSGRIRAIVIADMSRISRDVNALLLVSSYLQSQQVRLISVDQVTDTNTDEN